MNGRPDPASRFADRAADYVRGRPGYPAPLFDDLAADAGLAAGATIADIGAGTGLSSEPWLERAFRVEAVEPNGAMREAAAARLGRNRRFRAVAGRAEATGLPDASVDLVFAAQAFHWFDPAAARAEFRRILRSPPRVALVWNARRATGTPFLADYEALLDRFGTDYHQVGHRGIAPERLQSFFGGPFAKRSYENRQRLDLEGLRARLVSSSYVPAKGEARHEEMLAALESLFRAHEEDGAVTVVYDCEVFLGTLAG